MHPIARVYSQTFKLVIPTSAGSLTRICRSERVSAMAAGGRVAPRPPPRERLEILDLDKCPNVTPLLETFSEYKNSKKLYEIVLKWGLTYGHSDKTSSTRPEFSTYNYILIG